jgi:protein TonB
VRPGGPAAGLAKVAEPSLGLTVDANAGHLLLSWNPNSPLVSAATRATLTIRDGDHQEDVDLDLATLREGSLVYTPISNDASFRLVVADQTTGRTTAESVRRLAGGPSQVVAAASFPHLRPEAARPAAATSEKPSSPPLEPTLAERRQQAPAPQVAAITVVTAQPAKENSLAARLSAATPIEIPAAPALDSQPDAFAGNAPNLPGASAAAPTPPVPAARQQPPKAAASAVPVAAPFPSLRIGGQAQQARLIKQFPAAYPATAKSWHITGNVRVLAVVGKSGRVRKATAISGPEILHSAAVGSVMKWIYSPAILNGEPVEAQTQVDVNFHTGM